MKTGQKATIRQKGNLGEHIAFRIGHAKKFAGWQLRTSNALSPLSDNSAAGVDITWLFLSDTDPSLDVVVIQETKTTENKEDLAYAYELTQDYKKLFALDPTRTLQARLQVLANALEFEYKFREEQVHRVIALGKSRADLTTQVSLVPTLLHDRSADPMPKLLAVRTSIISFGWNVSQISPWSVAMESFGDRLERLAHGQS